MRRALSIAVVALAMCALPGDAAAHDSPPTHRAVVQADRGALSVLVTYEPGRNKAGDPGLGALTASAYGEARKRVLEATLSARALAPLRVTVNGAPINFDRVRTKVVFGRGPGGYTVYVLATARVARGQVVRASMTSDPHVARKAPGAARISWLDRSGKRVTAAAPQRRWLPAGTEIALRFAR